MAWRGFAAPQPSRQPMASPWRFWIAAMALASTVIVLVPGGHSGGALAVVAAALVATLLVGWSGRLGAPPTAPASAGVSMRRRAWMARTPRLTDPDAAGRPRPRAPTQDPSAA